MEASQDLTRAQVWQSQADEALRARNRAMRDAHTEGASLREIARVVGLSHETVRRIVIEGMSR